MASVGNKGCGLLGVRALVCGACVLGWGATGRAQAKDDAPAGTVLFLQKGGLYQIAVSGGLPVKLADLPNTAHAESIEASRSGKTVLVNTLASASWIVGGRLRNGNCTGPAHLSRAGDRVLCPNGDHSVIHDLSRKSTQELPTDLSDVNFLNKTELAATSEVGVVAFAPKHPDKRRVIAKPNQRTHLLVAPSGQRAVAVVGDKDESRIFTFALDGVGVLRQLGGPGLPIAWSEDSVWVLLQVGEAPDLGDGESEGAGWAPATGVLATPVPKAKRPPSPSKIPTATNACAARAIGGESKCWNGFRAIAFSPTARYVLLFRDHSLYIGEMKGPRPEPPRRLVQNVDGPAAWIR